MTDTERLNYILRRADDDFRFDIGDILGDYEGDDEEQYFASARQAIDGAMTDESNLENYEFSFTLVA